MKWIDYDHKMLQEGALTLFALYEIHVCRTNLAHEQ